MSRTFYRFLRQSEHQPVRSEFCLGQTFLGLEDTSSKQHHPHSPAAMVTINGPCLSIYMPVPTLRSRTLSGAAMGISRCGHIGIGMASSIGSLSQGLKWIIASSAFLRPQAHLCGAPVPLCTQHLLPGFSRLWAWYCQ